MATGMPQNNEQQQQQQQPEQSDPVVPANQHLSPFPSLSRSSPPRPIFDTPMIRSVSSESDHDQTTDVLRSSGPTNPTTALTSAPPDKSEQYSEFEHGLMTGRVPSAISHEIGADSGRYPSIIRPRPAMALDSNMQNGFRQVSGLDWIPPNSAAAEKRREKTVGDRLESTLTVASRERDSYAKKARYYGWALNVAIGLQVVIGAITTGVAAATTGRSTSIGISVLGDYLVDSADKIKADKSSGGGMSTMLASYLAKARGSNEPEHSNLRSRELDTFIREIEAWMMDKGHLVGSTFDSQIIKFRERFEDIIRTAGEDTNTTGFDAEHPRSVQNHPRGPTNNLKAMERV